MKKLSVIAIMAALSVGVFSCQPDGESTAPANDSTSAVGANPAAADAGNTVNAEPASNLPLTTVSFMEENHNFGEVKDGQKVSHTYKFKNTGTNPLKVENVKPACGCTTPDWSKEDIAPGSEGFVTVEFDSKGKTGVQKKSVTVTFANTDPKTKVLNFSAEVVAP